MKLLFITPCYEPGKDGVGDYTRRLIQLISSDDHSSISCKVISWNDGFVENGVSETDLLRFPTHFSESDKALKAGEFIDVFHPDWISLQWVPHGYDSKGLFFKQIASLAQVCRGYHVHWMIHEIWLGAKGESTSKERLIGTLQRYLFRKLFRKIQPACISTQSRAYAFLLENKGYPIRRLPLPSNIKYTPSATPRGNEDKLIAGIFSHLHRDLPVESFMPQFIQLAQTLGRKAILRHAGKNSDDGQRIWKEWEQRWGASIQFESLGLLSESDVSRFLQEIDFGISMTAFALSDKSGVNAAFWHHGVPVYCLSDHVHFEGFDALSELASLDIGGPNEPLGVWWNRRKPSRSRSDPAPVSIASQFLNALRIH